MYSEASKGEPTRVLAKYIDRRRLEDFLGALLPQDAKSSFVVKRKLDYWIIEGPMELNNVSYPGLLIFDLF